MSVESSGKRSGLQDVWRAMDDLLGMVEATENVTESDRAEGQRFVAGLYKWGLERVFRASDPLRPQFVRFTDPYSNWGFPNPDNLYLLAEVGDDREYLVRGHRGTCATFVVEARTGIGRREDNVHSRCLAFVEAHELQLREDGTFMLHVGGPAGPPNHLPLPEGANTIFVRATFGDWSTEALPPFTIERLDGAPASAPSPADLDQTAANFRRMADIIRSLGRFNDSVARDWAAKSPVNSFPPTDKEITLAPFPGQRSCVARFCMPGPDEALIVEIPAVECSYLGFSVGHLHWYTNLDHHQRFTSLNNYQARPSRDGSLRLVVSSIDIGAPNWIDTGGHREGFMFFRCQGLVGDQLPQPTASLVAASKVFDVLPPGEPRVTPAERAAALVARQVGASRRYAY